MAAATRHGVEGFPPPPPDDALAEPGGENVAQEAMGYGGRLGFGTE